MSVGCPSAQRSRRPRTGGTWTGRVGVSDAADTAWPVLGPHWFTATPTLACAIRARRAGPERSRTGTDG